jgi:probable phosphoglycerate mutase
MPLIYLIRHAENRANVERVMSHKVIDYSLTELGVRQSAALGRWFLDRSLERVYSSPLKRALETAQAVADATGAPVEAVEPLRELDVGELDGRGDPESWQIHDDVVARWIKGDWEARFPGGESYREAYDRLAGLLVDLAARHTSGDVAAVGHGGLFTTVLPRLCTVAEHDGVNPLRLKNTGVTVIHHEGGVLTCQLWGGVEHLPDADQSGGRLR